MRNHDEAFAENYELEPFEEWQLENPNYGNILPNYSREQDEQDFRFPTTQELNYFFNLENNPQ